MTVSHIDQRFDRVYLVLTGIFLGTLAMINMLGLSRFIDLSFTLGAWNIPMVIPIGVLPYPITFLCIDVISEFYGKERANLVVWVGLLVNVWILFVLWLSGMLPPFIEELPPVSHPDYLFFKMRLLSMSAITGSMIAYLCAQFLDIRLFLLCKKLTGGKYLWLRNNVSTGISQLADTVIVILIAYCFSDGFLQNHQASSLSQISSIILSAYTYKLIAAVLSTLPFYLIVLFLKQYFRESNPSSTCSSQINSAFTR